MNKLRHPNTDIKTIKFRAYDLKFNKYVYDIQHGGLISAWTSAHTKTSKLLSFDEFLSQQNRFVIEQYTGCRDGDDNLIYEGDIVHVPGWSTSFVVVFKYGKFLLRKYNGSLYLMPPDMYVVGNIYENADLLKGSKKQWKNY